MVCADIISLGDTVRDLRLGQVWILVGRDGEGTVFIERNGVTASASIWDVERFFGDMAPVPICPA